MRRDPQKLCWLGFGASFGHAGYRMPLVTYASEDTIFYAVKTLLGSTCYLSNQLRQQLPHESVMDQSDKNGAAATKMRSPRQQPAFVTELNENDVL